MQTHHAVALVFALLALPAFVSARWLRDGRLPLAGGGHGMTEAQRRALDARLAALMRMIGVAMLATAAGMAMWGGDESRVLALTLVMVVAVNALAVAMLVAVARARRGGRGRGG